MKIHHTDEDIGQWWYLGLYDMSFPHWPDKLLKVLLHFGHFDKFIDGLLGKIWRKKIPA